jgi:crotonyl-CoA carboxylase/reductase
MSESLPKEMAAWVVREERHGEPLLAMKLETVPVPTARAGEVIVRVRAAGINYNHVWACKGKPVPISALHPDEPSHIGGSDASGTIVAIGEGVRYWKIGDEVITHPNQTCGQCPACNGFDPLACENQKAWGFETSWGSFGQYARVQAQQLLPKPKALSWEAAATYGLKLFTAYRMLFVSTQVKPGEYVLVWGAAGGLGSYAIQLCRAVNAFPICVVNSAEKEAYCRSLGAELFIYRNEFDYLSAAEPTSVPNAGMRAFRRKVRELTGGDDVDITFEHVGAATFPTSVFVTKRFGKVVICGATSGYQLAFDARYLWMHQKQIVGSHGCNLADATRANRLVEKNIIKPTLTRTFSFNDGARAHQTLLADQGRMGSFSLVID